MVVYKDGNTNNGVISLADHFNYYFRGKGTGMENFNAGRYYMNSGTITINVHSIKVDELELEAIIGYFNILNDSNYQILFIGTNDDFHDKLCHIILDAAKNDSNYYNHWFNNFLPFNEYAFIQFVNIHSNNISIIAHGFYYYLYSNTDNRIKQPIHYSYDDVVTMLRIIRHSIIVWGDAKEFHYIFIRVAPPDADYRNYIGDEAYSYINSVKKDFYYDLSEEYQLGVAL